MAKLRWRYVVPGALIVSAALVAGLAARGLAIFPDDAPVLEVMVGLYVVGACAWAFGAALDRTRLIWRLSLIWLPAVLPVVGTVWAMQTTEDDMGFGLLFLMLPTGIIVVACLLAMALATQRHELDQGG